VSAASPPSWKHAGRKSALLAAPWSGLSSPPEGSVELPPAKPPVPRLARLGARALSGHEHSPLAEPQAHHHALTRVAAKERLLGSLARALGGGSGSGGAE